MTNFSRPSISSAGDVLVEIAARNTLLQSQLAQAEAMVQRSTRRMNAASTFALGGGGRVGAGGGAGGFGAGAVSGFVAGGGGRGVGGQLSALAKGTGVFAGFAAIPAAISALETNALMVKGIIAALSGNMEDVFKNVSDVSQSAHRFATGLPILGGLIDGAIRAVSDVVQRHTGVNLLGTITGFGKDEAAKKTEQGLAGPFTAQTTLGAMKIGAVTSTDSQAVRQTVAMNEVKEIVRSIDRNLQNLNLVVAQ